MTIVPQSNQAKVKFTPEYAVPCRPLLHSVLYSLIPYSQSFRLLITAPRRSPAVPNAKGTLALFTLSTYSLDAHSETKEIRVLNISDGTSVLFSNDVADKSPQWLGDEDDVFWLRDGKDENGETEIWVGSVGAEKG